MHIYAQAGKADFVTLEKKVMEWLEPSVASGKQVLNKFYSCFLRIIHRLSFIVYHRQMDVI